MTLLDDPEEADFYQEVLVRHADKWRVLAVRIDDGLAGYAICLRDDRTLRVWDNRVSPDWGRYSAGLIANAEVVVSAGADPAVTEVDWGCGVQRYKTSMSSDLMTGDDLMAWSSVLLASASRGGAATQRSRVAAGRPLSCREIGHLPARLPHRRFTPYTAPGQPIVVAAQIMRRRATYAAAEGGVRES